MAIIFAPASPGRPFSTPFAPPPGPPTRKIWHPFGRDTGSSAPRRPCLPPRARHDETRLRRLRAHGRPPARGGDAHGSPVPEAHRPTAGRGAAAGRGLGGPAPARPAAGRRVPGGAQGPRTTGQARAPDRVPG